MSRKRKGKEKNRGGSRAGSIRTPIERHQLMKGRLVPPAQKVIGDKMSFSSWMDERLPEMLWAALVISAVGREKAIEHFNSLLDFIYLHDRKDQLYDVTITGISRLDEALRNDIIQFIANMPGASDALSSMLLVESLPCRGDWERSLRPYQPDPTHLMEAVGPILWHQSPEATDCRWLMVAAHAVAGKLSIKRGLLVAEDIRAYPDLPSGREGSTIRALEIALSNPPGGAVDRTWPQTFWQTSWDKTPCIESTQRFSLPSIDPKVTRDAVTDLREKLQRHWEQTHVTTGIDARHDAVFGMGWFCIRILEEMLSVGIGTSIHGRLGLRTVLEVFVNLTYLLRKDDPAIWTEWRQYGAGQAKLNSLRFAEVIEPPKYIDTDALDLIASEDIWEEFLTMNVASWSGQDLRTLSQEAGLQDLYDRYYSWTSGYAHGMWGAVRESGFQVCGNPLHRFHRYPTRLFLQDTVDDAAMLVDKIMACIDSAYPTFAHRLTGN